MVREIAEDADLASTCTGFADMIVEPGDSITREVSKANRKLNRPEYYEEVVVLKDALFK
jgi:hypothetical protein